LLPRAVSDVMGVLDAVRIKLKLAPLPGRRRGFHPPPPTDPDVSLSAHPARAVQSSGQ
jgi:hypothetical protein